MKKALLISCFILSIGIADNFSDTLPANVEYFKAGDILYPDYAISDTLVVLDEVSLNKDIAAIEQGFIESSDGEIAKVFYSHCRIK